MGKWQVRLFKWLPVLALAMAPAAHAQWAVVDVGAINQLVQEVVMMRQTLSTTQQALAEARRGDEVVRNSKRWQASHQIGSQRAPRGVSSRQSPSDSSPRSYGLRGRQSAFRS